MCYKAWWMVRADLRAPAAEAGVWGHRIKYHSCTWFFYASVCVCVFSSFSQCVLCIQHCFTTHTHGDTHFWDFAFASIHFSLSLVLYSTPASYRLPCTPDFKLAKPEEPLGGSKKELWTQQCYIVSFQFGIKEVSVSSYLAHCDCQLTMKMKANTEVASSL